MLRFLFRQFVMLVLVFAAIIFLAHFGMYGLANAQMETGAAATSHILQQALSDSLSYYAHLARGDWGAFTTFNRTVAVADVLWPAYKNSLGLMGAALGVAALLGALLGVILTLTKHQATRLSLLTITTIGISVPSFLAVVLLQQVGIQFNATLGRRLVSMAGFEWSLEKMLLPVLILIARPTAYITRSVYISLSQILEEDYMRTAVAKGLPPLRWLFHHALPNLAIPYLSALGVSLRFSFSTLIVVEFLFAWPGLGRNLLAAIGEGLTPLVVGLALAIGLTVLAANFLLDVSYYLIDPRIREEE